MRNVFAIFLVACLVSLTGCNIIAWPLYVLAPAPKKTVKAEFDKLPGKTVAVLVWADMDTLYEYPYVREELSTAINQELESNIRDVRVIDPLRVVRFQDSDVRWHSRPMDEVGRSLEADYVLYISLAEFSTYAPGSISLPKGRITAHVSIWDTGPQADAGSGCVWQADSMTVEQEADSQVLLQNDTLLRTVTQRRFAEALARRFYDHKVEVE